MSCKSCVACAAYWLVGSSIKTIFPFLRQANVMANSWRSPWEKVSLEAIISRPPPCSMVCQRPVFFRPWMISCSSEMPKSFAYSRILTERMSDSCGRTTKRDRTSSLARVEMSTSSILMRPEDTCTRPSNELTSVLFPLLTDELASCDN